MAEGDAGLREAVAGPPNPAGKSGKAEGRRKKGKQTLPGLQCLLLSHREHPCLSLPLAPDFHPHLRDSRAQVGWKAVQGP